MPLNLLQHLSAERSFKTCCFNEKDTVATVLCWLCGNTFLLSPIKMIWSRSTPDATWAELCWCRSRRPGGPRTPAVCCSLTIAAIDLTSPLPAAPMGEILAKTTLVGPVLAAGASWPCPGWSPANSPSPRLVFACVAEYTLATSKCFAGEIRR